MRERWALFESPALGDEKFDVRSIDGVDELNQLFRFDVVLVRPGLVSAIDDVLPTLEKPASCRLFHARLAFSRADGGGYARP